MTKRRWFGEVIKVTNPRFEPDSPEHQVYKQKQKDYYYATHDAQKEAARLRVARKRKRNQQYLVNYLQGKKCPCGVSDPRLLAFDHREDAQKFGNISDIVSRGAALQKLIDEIPKCDIRCHNCHMLLTLRRMGGSYHDVLVPISDKEFNDMYGGFTQ